MEFELFIEVYSIHWFKQNTALLSFAHLYGRIHILESEYLNCNHHA